MGDDVSTGAVEALRTVKLDLATREVVEALRGAGVESILLRGPAIARWLYPDTPRPYTDVDLLVPPDAFQRAEAIVEELGYVGVSGLSSEFDRPEHDSTWLRDADGTRVEVHRTLEGVGAPGEVLWRELAAEQDELDLGIGGFRVPSLRPKALALVVGLHAAQHGGAMPWPVADLERALSELPPDAWEDVVALARRVDAVPALAVGLRMTSRGRELADRLELPEEHPVVVELRHANAPPMSLAFEWLHNLPGFRAKATFVARELFPPVDFMRARSTLARHGPAGLGAAYAWRPLVLAARVPAGFAAWRRARRRRSARAPG